MTTTTTTTPLARSEATTTILVRTAEATTLARTEEAMTTLARSAETTRRRTAETVATTTTTTMTTRMVRQALVASLVVVEVVDSGAPLLLHKRTRIVSCRADAQCSLAATTILATEADNKAVREDLVATMTLPRSATTIRALEVATVANLKEAMVVNLKEVTEVTIRLRMATTRILADMVATKTTTTTKRAIAKRAHECQNIYIKMNRN